MFPSRRPDIIGTEVDGEMVILDVHRGKIHHLNATASYIWTRCDGRRSAADIAEALASQFEIDANIARKDVERVVAQLKELHLVVETNSTGKN